MVEHIIGGSIVSIGIYALVRFINKDIGTSKLCKEIYQNILKLVKIANTLKKDFCNITELVKMELVKNSMIRVSFLNLVPMYITKHKNKLNLDTM